MAPNLHLCLQVVVVVGVVVGQDDLQPVLFAPSAKNTTPPPTTAPTASTTAMAGPAVINAVPPKIVLPPPDLGANGAPVPPPALAPNAWEVLGQYLTPDIWGPALTILTGGLVIVGLLAILHVYCRKIGFTCEKTPKSSKSQKRLREEGESVELETINYGDNRHEGRRHQRQNSSTWYVDVDRLHNEFPGSKTPDNSTLLHAARAHLTKIDEMLEAYERNVDAAKQTRKPAAPQPPMSPKRGQVHTLNTVFEEVELHSPPPTPATSVANENAAPFEERRID